MSDVKPTRKPIREAAGLGLLIPAGVTLALTVLSPFVLATDHLIHWSRSPLGLDLPAPLYFLPPFALDFAALYCVVMALWCAFLGWKSTTWSLMVWVFAGSSAWVQHQAGLDEPGTDKSWAMPALALVAPVMLELGLWFFRKLVLTQANERHTGGLLRWLVAPVESFRMAVVRVREEIPEPAAQREYVRNRSALSRLMDADRLRYALAELKTTDVHQARVWLQFLRMPVAQVTVDEVQAELDRPEQVWDLRWGLPFVPDAQVPQPPPAANRSRKPSASTPVSGGPTGRSRSATATEKEDQRAVNRLKAAARRSPDGLLSVTDVTKILDCGFSRAERLGKLAGVLRKEAARIPTSPGLGPVGDLPTLTGVKP